MTKQELLKQQISKANDAADAAYTAAAYDAAEAAYIAAYDAAYTAAYTANAAADYDKHIALLDKAIERAHVVTQNCIWETQVLKYKKEKLNEN